MTNQQVLAFKTGVPRWNVLLLLLFMSMSSHAQEWLSHYNESVRLFNEDNIELAFEEGEQALQLYENGEPLEQANYRVLLRQISVICYSLDYLEKGLSFAEKEVNNWRENNQMDDVAYLDALDNLGMFYASLDNSQQAEKVFQEAFDKSQGKSRDPATMAILEGHLAEAQFVSGKLDESAMHFKQSLNVLDKVEDVAVDYLQFCYSYGTLCNERHDYRKALKYFSLLLEWYTTSEDQEPIVIEAKTGLGTAYTSLGNLKEGEKYYKSALEASKGINDDEIMVQITKLLVLNLEKQDRNDEAAELLNSVQSLVSSGNNPEEKAVMFNNQGSMALKSGDLPGALAMFQKAIEQLNEASDMPGNLAFEILMNVSRAYARADNLENALKYALQASTKIDPGSLEYFEAKIELVSLYRRSGAYDNAARLVREVMEADRSSWPTSIKAKILNMMAVQKQFMGDYKTAKQLYDEALSFADPDEQSLYQGIVLNQLSLQQTMGDYATIEQSLDELKLALKADPLFHLQILVSLGELSRSQAQYAQAERYYLEAINLTAENSPQYVHILTGLASLKSDQADYSESEELFIKARAILVQRQQNNGVEYAGLINNLAILYQKMGIYDKAEEGFLDAASIYKQISGDRNPEYVVSLENLAAVYERKGDLERALDILGGTLKVNLEIYGENHPFYATSLNNYAALLQKMKRNKEAVRLLAKATEIQSQNLGTSHPAYANSLHNLAILYQEEGNLNYADSLFDEVLSIRRSIYRSMHPSITSALLSKAIVLQGLEKYELALSLFNQVIDQFLFQIAEYFPSLSEKEKTAFYANLLPVVNRYKEFCVAYYMQYEHSSAVLEKLYNVQLATKAILLNAVNKTRKNILKSNDENLIAKFNKWNDLKDQLVKYAGLTKKQLSDSKISIRGLEDQANSLEKELSLQSEDFADGFDQSVVTWQDVQHLLDDSEAAIELMRINSSLLSDSVIYAALLLSHSSSSPELVILPLGQSLESRYLRYYQNTIKFMFTDERSYNNYWQLIDDRLNGIKTVYVSSDGVFNKINVNTFRNPATHNYLLDKYIVKYVSSTRDIVSSVEPNWSSGENTAMLFGNPTYSMESKEQAANGIDKLGSAYNFRSVRPLPGTKAEINYIDSLLSANQWNVNSYEARNASEQILRNSAAPKILHLATHGFFLKDLKAQDVNDIGNNTQENTNPLFRSGLLFSGVSDNHRNTSNDGVLTAYEVMNMGMEGTKLVVLSACETALGDVKNGEGVYGLQRALLVAGVQSIIMSLWKVDDQATQALMNLFYNNLVQGEEIHTALQKAQQKMQESYKEPYYWGAFVIIGV